MSRISFQQFKQQLGSTFATQSPQSTEITLTEAKMARSAAEGYECFSLIFSGPGPCLPQGVYTLSHSSLPEQELFIVPIGQSDNDYHYECVFNRPS